MSVKKKTPLVRRSQRLGGASIDGDDDAVSDTPSTKERDARLKAELKAEILDAVGAMLDVKLGARTAKGDDSSGDDSDASLRSNPRNIQGGSKKTRSSKKTYSQPNTKLTDKTRGTLRFDGKEDPKLYIQRFATTLRFHHIETWSWPEELIQCLEGNAFSWGLQFQRDHPDFRDMGTQDRIDLIKHKFLMRFAPNYKESILGDLMGRKRIRQDNMDDLPNYLDSMEIAIGKLSLLEPADMLPSSLIGFLLLEGTHPRHHELAAPHLLNGTDYPTVLQVLRSLTTTLRSPNQASRPTPFKRDGGANQHSPQPPVTALAATIRELDQGHAIDKATYEASLTILDKGADGAAPYVKFGPNRRLGPGVLQALHSTCEVDVGTPFPDEPSFYVGLHAERERALEEGRDHMRYMGHNFDLQPG